MNERRIAEIEESLARLERGAREWRAATRGLPDTRRAALWRNWDQELGDALAAAGELLAEVRRLRPYALAGMLAAEDRAHERGRRG